VRGVRRAGRVADASDRIDVLLHDPQSPVAKDVPADLRRRACDVVVERNPGEGRYGNNAGFWYREARDYERSLRHYLASCEAAPDDQDFLNDTGLIYLFHFPGRKDECPPFLERAVALVEEQGQPPERGYWDALENLCKYWFEKGEWQRVVDLAKKRADPRATLNGRPYPSARAAQHGAQAARKLADARKR
jgi:hypothetical protein